MLIVMVLCQHTVLLQCHRAERVHTKTIYQNIMSQHWMKLMFQHWRLRTDLKVDRAEGSYRSADLVSCFIADTQTAYVPTIISTAVCDVGVCLPSVHSTFLTRPVLLPQSTQSLMSPSFTQSHARAQQEIGTLWWRTLRSAHYIKPCLMLLRQKISSKYDLLHQYLD